MREKAGSMWLRRGRTSKFREQGVETWFYKGITFLALLSDVFAGLMLHLARILQISEEINFFNHKFCMFLLLLPLLLPLLLLSPPPRMKSYK
jgi:succinate dehydrogenase hydrophobic anchor subunit